MYKALLLSCSLLLLTNIFAQTAGGLDQTFNTTGYVYTGLSCGPQGRGAVAIQTDGQIIIAGRTYTTYWRFAMTRYSTTGVIDNTFGINGNGVVHTGMYGLDDEANAIVLQPDGKIILAGLASTGANYDFAIARFKPNGTLDSTFGTNGRVITAIGTSQDIIQAVTLQTDGKIVVAGYASNGTNTDVAVARYNTNGSVDNTFGTGGKVITSMGTTDDMAYAVVVQPNGKIVIAGYRANIANTADFLVARYKSTGTLDSTFGTNGIKVTPLGGTLNIALSVALQSDNKIVACGYNSIGSNREFAVLRFDTLGNLDNNWGGTGKVFTDFGSANDEAYWVLVQPDGKIIAAGYADDGTHKHFALARYSSTGVLDNNFGASGIVNTPFLSTTDDVGSTAALQSDGKIVVGGRSALAGNYQYVIARYNGLATAVVSVPTFGSGATSTRCQGAGSVTYAATASNSTSITYSLDATSLNAGVTINASTGEVAYPAGYTGTAVITATAAGNGGPTTSTHTVTINPSVSGAAFTAGATTLCAGQISTYTATGTNATSVTYQVLAGGGATIDANNGGATNVTGDFTVRATLTNSCGSVTVDRAVTITPGVTSPSFTAGATALCEGETSTYTATATNATGVTYEILPGGGATIDANTGAVTNVTGSFIVEATFTNSCSSITFNRSVTVSFAVDTPNFVQGSSSYRCAGAGVITYDATAANSTGITYSLDAAALNAGNTINSATGEVTWAANYTGTSTITANATGNCGPATSASHAVNIVQSATPTIVVTPIPNDTICAGTTVTFNAAITAGGSAPVYEWRKSNVVVGGNSASYTDSTLGSGATITCTLTSNLICASPTTATSNTINITVVPSAVTPVITQTGNTLQSTAASSYQWYLNGNLINGATSQTYTATQSGNYTVRTTSAFGCSATSSVSTVVISGITDITGAGIFEVYPNPANSNVIVSLGENLQNKKIELFDVNGKQLLETNASGNQVTLDISGLADGVYIVRIANHLKRLVKM